MVFILSKLLLFLIKPLVWVFFLILSAIFSKSKLRRKRLIVAGIIVLLLFSNSFIVGKILNGYEATTPTLTHYDYGIVLGGFSGTDEKTNAIRFNWTADRLYQTIHLYEKGVVENILVTSGSSNISNNEIKEADQVYKYLRGIGIPDSAIVIESKSRNTLENARYSTLIIKRLNPKAKVLVITSAWHIPRAKLIFSKYMKENITYYPTNYMGKIKYSWSDYFVPSLGALINWQFLIKEWIGLIVDRFRN